MIQGCYVERYIITPPWSCSKLSDKAPSSYRHSVTDWSDLKQTKSRGFDKVDAIVAIVRAGEALRNETAKIDGVKLLI
jgi:hypothetical protein